MDMFLNDVPTFNYSYEEEQGWGAEFEIIDGEEIRTFEWDTPDWEETDHDDIYFLATKHMNSQGTFLVGYYLYGSLDEYAGDNLEEAIEELN